jgi:hypothetical protein
MVSKILDIINIKAVEKAIHQSVPSRCYTMTRFSLDASHVNLEQQSNMYYLDQNGNLYTVQQLTACTAVCA